MVEIGHKLISGLHGPTDLVEYAQLTERSEFAFAAVSNHYHPWIPEQGESPMVWNVLGGIAQATDDLAVLTAVTCPTTRVHPAIIAQPTAITAAMFDGRFDFGVGTGENLSEHLLGDRCPEHRVRLGMLAEAIEVIEALWTGETISHHDEHYTVENTRLFTLPDELPEIIVAADVTKTARKAGELAGGLMAVTPDEELVDRFREANEDGPVYGEATVCWADNEADAVDTAHRLWRQTTLPGALIWDMPTPAHFAQATESVPREAVADSMPCGPDPDEHIGMIQAYEDVGFEKLAVHQVRDDQSEFVEFYQTEVLPSFH